MTKPADCNRIRFSSLLGTRRIEVGWRGRGLVRVQAEVTDRSRRGSNYNEIETNGRGGSGLHG
jgi:hypothetical protein